MKRIKKFSAFFESQNSSDESSGGVIIMRPQFDDVYPYLNMSWDWYSTGDDLEENIYDSDDLWKMLCDHREGPLGNGGWKKIENLIDDYYSGGGGHKEEYIEEVQEFLDVYNIEELEAENILDSPGGMERLKKIYLEKEREDFHKTYNLGDAWNFIVVLSGLNQDITTSYSNLDEEMIFDKISSITREENLYVFAYQKNDPNFYRVLRGKEFVEMDVKVSEVEDVIEDLFIKTEGPEDATFMSKIPISMAKKIYRLKGFDLNDLNKIRDLGDFGFFD